MTPGAVRSWSNDPRSNFQVEDRDPGLQAPMPVQDRFVPLIEPTASSPKPAAKPED